MAVIVVALIGYFTMKDSPEKYYRKAKRTHKKAEKIYSTGEYELAEEYYTEADEFRKKARELS
ncbi:hypothetical protein HOC80_00930 [archaeon]|nr:hypothetical protein [archaeon]MBT4416646.1 hypothetical protein [archaeon]